MLGFREDRTNKWINQREKKQVKVDRPIDTLGEGQCTKCHCLLTYNQNRVGLMNDRCNVPERALKKSFLIIAKS